MFLVTVYIVTYDFESDSEFSIDFGLEMLLQLFIYNVSDWFDIYFVQNS
jgi:hypothetical protein